MPPDLVRPKSSHEIERKFLLQRIPINLKDFPGHEIAQGYLAVENDGTQVRLRRKGPACLLAFKTRHGAVREEREIELSEEQFESLWPATSGRRLRKTRYEVPSEGLTIEVDFFRGKHDGLVVAEVEFSDLDEAQRFEPPEWFGAEVTNDPDYSNVKLACE